ncbi:MAG: acyltransferase [Dysgonamonadaceae bacterium]
MQKISASAFSDTKPHYEILDGLRGVAAFMVICYHVFEGFATSPIDQRFNHGYLAVDFFFVLSGFVVGYAYDDRWNKMKIKDFFKRRLIRLHPMVVMGAILGAITFVIQGSVQWDGTQVPFYLLITAFILTIFMIPAVPGTGPEVRGNGEMFPLNGPSWSLFFEYIGNILYALFIRRMSTKALSILVAISGISLASFAMFNLSGYGSLGVGWTMADYNLLGGFLRMIFAYSAGLLISRNFKPIHIRGAFWKCSIAIVILLSVPHLGAEGALWMNGLYDTVCTLVFFPILVYFGASGATTDKVSSKINKFMGDISYPLYMVHYPFMYLFYAWLWKNNLTFSETWPVAIVLVLGCVLIAYLSLKFYDEPLRKRLNNKFLKK